MDVLNPFLGQELAERSKRAEAAEAIVAAVPIRVRSFLEDVSAMDVRKAKGQLQSILSAAYVYRDDHIELEFRTT